MYCIYGNVLERENQSKDVITLVLHGSQDRITEGIAEQLKNWNSAVSFAVVLENVTSDSTACFFQNLLPIWFRFRSYLSIHFLVPSQSANCPNLEFTMSQNLSPCSSVSPTAPHLSISKITSYPVNLARNTARSFATSKYILMADMDNFFSELFEVKMRALADDFYKNKDNHKTVLVYRIFDISDVYAKNCNPLTKDQLKDLLRNGTAAEFHAYFKHGHRIPLLEDWIEKESEGIQFYRKYSFPEWEPRFVALSSIPFHDENFLYPIRDNTVLSWELCRSNYSFAVVYNHFLYHLGFKQVKARQFLDMARRRIFYKSQSALSEFNRRMDLLYPQTKKSCPVYQI